MLRAYSPNWLPERSKANYKWVTREGSCFNPPLVAFVITNPIRNNLTAQEVLCYFNPF